jgi:hypothetical protein
MKPKNTPRIHEPANRQGGQRLKTLLPSLVLLLALVAIAAYPLLHPQEQEITPPSQSIDESSVPPASQRAAAEEPLTAPIPPSDDDKNEPRNTLDQYPKAESTWGDTLNPGGTVPAQGYAAYYINQKNPRQTIAQENVTSIAMNYAWDKFHGIPSEQFGAYWVGRLHVPQKALYYISGDLSWAKMRVLLDKHIIIEGEGNTSLELDAGDYLLEVEYLNNWHTVGFHFAITPAVTELDEEALPAIIAAQKLPADTVTYAVGVYESASRDNHILLQAPAGDTPYILLLGSYNAVQWDISGRAPALVIYNGAWHSSSVRSDGGNTPLLAWKGNIDHDLGEQKPRGCSCHGGHFHCEGSGNTLGEFAERVRTMTAFPLAGYSGKYSTDALNIPEIVINAENLAASAQVQADIDAQRRSCTNKSEAGFEDIMKKDS